MPSKLITASFWAIAGSATQNVTTFLLLVYLARVLQPRDFGLMATVAVGLDLGMMVARWGQVELIQQQRYRTDEARNQALRLSLGISMIFATLFVAGAKPLGGLYHSKQLTQMMYICAPVFPLSAVRFIAEAILRSEFRFRLLAFRNTTVTLISAGLAVLMASRGFGPLTLAVQRLVSVVMMVVWVWPVIGWRPRIFGRLPWSRPLASEGGEMMVGTLLPLVVPGTVDLMVGAILGPSQLGLMRVAYRISDFVSQMVVMPLVGIANAELSTLSQDLEAMRRSYLRLTQASAALMCPVLFGLALVAPDVIPMIFGAKWRPSVPLVQIVSLVSLVAPVNLYFPAAMVALGQSRLVLRQGVLQLCLGLVLAVIAAQISLAAVVAAHVVRMTFVCASNCIDVRRHMGLKMRTLVQFMAAPYLSTAAMSIAVIGAQAVIGHALPAIARVGIVAGLGAVVYGITLWLGAAVGLWPAHTSMLDGLLPSRWRKAEAASGVAP